MAGKHKNRSILVIGIAISALFLWLALRDADLAQIADSLRLADWRYVPALLAVIAVFFWIKTVRWRVLLMPLATLRSTALFPVVVVGYASNILLPAQLGELVRTYLGARKFGLRAAPVLVTVILERVFDFLTILLFVGVILILEDGLPRQLTVAGYVCGGIGVGALFLAGLHAYRPTILSRIFFFITSMLPQSPRKLLNSQFELATQGLESLKDLRRLVEIATWSVAQWLVMGLCIWISIAALHLDVPVSAAYVVLAVLIVGMTVPSSPGFFGTIQLCFTLGLAPFGIDAGPAIATSVFFHATMFVSVAVAGILFVNRLGYSPKSLVHESENVLSGPQSRNEAT